MCGCCKVRLCICMHACMHAVGSSGGLWTEGPISHGGGVGRSCGGDGGGGGREGGVVVALGGGSTCQGLLS